MPWTPAQTLGIVLAALAAALRLTVPTRPVGAFSWPLTYEALA